MYVEDEMLRSLLLVRTKEGVTSSQMKRLLSSFDPYIPTLNDGVLRRSSINDMTNLDELHIQKVIDLRDVVPLTDEQFIADHDGAEFLLEDM